MTITRHDCCVKQHGPSLATKNLAEYDRAGSRTFTLQRAISLGDLIAAALKAGLTVMCPTCQSPLCIDRRAIRYMPGQRGGKAVRVAFCTGCERAEEF